MDFDMLEPLCDAYQIRDVYGRAEASQRVFHIELDVEFVHLVEPPGAGSDCHHGRLMPDVSREENYEYWIVADRLSQDAAGEQRVRDMLMEVGVMYTRRHEFMVQTVLSTAVSMASDERNRGAEFLPMRVSISCADPCIYRELVTSEDEGLATADEEADYMDTSEDEEEIVMIGPWLEGLTEAKVTEGSIDCAICCVDILVGSTGCSMPCCHVYHRECIARWLKNSRSCPLCRFELPSINIRDRL